MPVLKCPACGAKGEVRATEEAFEVRGQWPDGGWPVRRCNNRGAGLIVKIRVVPPGAKAKQIPAPTWEHMEAMWAEAFAEDEAEGSQDEALPAFDAGALELERAALAARAGLTYKPDEPVG